MRNASTILVGNPEEKGRRGKYVLRLVVTIEMNPTVVAWNMMTGL
jgi:hypothetical protein